MSKYEYSPPEIDSDCPCLFAIEVLGERWTLLILRAALAGTQHFEDFYRDLGIARNILSNRLSRLVEDGILEREVMMSDRRRIQYSLTEKGRELGLALKPLKQWGARWAIIAPGTDLSNAKTTRWGHNAVNKRDEP